MWADLTGLFTALASQDSFEIRNALRPNSVWIFGAIFLAIAGYALAWVYHHVPVIERYFERTIMVTSTNILGPVGAADSNSRHPARAVPLRLRSAPSPAPEPCSFCCSALPTISFGRA